MNFSFPSPSYDWWGHQLRETAVAGVRTGHP